MILAEVDDDDRQSSKSFELLEFGNAKAKLVKQTGQESKLKETAKRLLKVGDLNLLSWMDFLSKVLAVLKAEANSIVISDAEEALDIMHSSKAIWLIRYENHERLSWQHFLQKYFSLPDRLSTVTEVLASSWYHPNSFVKSLVSDTLILHEVDDERIAQVISKSFRLGGVEACVEIFLKDIHLRNRFSKIISIMTEPSQSSFLREFFHLCDINLRDRPVKLARLLSECQANRICQLTDKNFFLLSSSLPFAILACLFLEAPPTEPTLRSLATMWSVKDTLMLASIPEQVLMTQRLLVALSYVSFNQLQSSECESILLDGIQRHLSSGDQQVSLMGQVVAECFALMMADPPESVEMKFDLNESDQIVRALREAFFYSQDLFTTSVCVSTNPQLFQSTIKESDDFDDYARTEPVAGGKLLSTLERCAPIVPITAKDEEKRNAKIRKPRFLRDCLAYLKSDDVNKIEMALQETPQLLLSESLLLKQEIGVDLFRIILFLGDDYSITGFESLRKTILMQLLVDLPEVMGSFIIGELLHRRASLLQKLEVVVVIMKSLHALASENPILAKSSIENSNDNVYLQIFSHHMGIKPTKIKPLHPRLVFRKLINHAVLPLLKTLRSCESTIFNSQNNLLLEKIIYLVGLSMAHSEHLPEWEKLFSLFVIFVEPIIKDPLVKIERPIVGALIVAFNGAVNNWPPHVSILSYLELMAQLMKFLQENPQVRNLEDNHSVLAMSLQLKLNELCDPQRILKDVLDYEENSLRMNELSITN